MSFSLQSLGSYCIEKTEDYDFSDDKTFVEMIRVKGSESEPPYFTVPSHLYKYSETELGLYLKDHKNLWRPLGNLLNIKIHISNQELDVRFPISMFPKVSEIVPFVKKRGKGIQSDAFKEARSKTQFKRKKYGGKMEENEPNFKDKNPTDIFSLLEDENEKS